MGEVSTLKFTVPVGRTGGLVLGGAGTTWAVNVTDDPKSEGLPEVVTEVAVGALLTM